MTGVQTCALPISVAVRLRLNRLRLVEEPEETSMNRSFTVPVVVAVSSKNGKKLDWTRLLNTNYGARDTSASRACIHRHHHYHHPQDVHASLAVVVSLFGVLCHCLVVVVTTVVVVVVVMTMGGESDDGGDNGGVHC